MIVKMQRSIDSFPKGEEAILICNKERTIEMVIPINEHSVMSLNGRKVAYFESQLINGQLALRSEIPNPGW